MASESIERGMQSVPRGLPVGLTSYLNSLDAVVRRLAGLARGADEARAVRRVETPNPGTGVGGGYGYALADPSMPRDDSVTSRKIAAGAVNSEKLAAGAVTGAKIALSAVTGDKLAAGAVTERELAARAVTAEKLGADVFPAVAEGVAAHGETVNIGVWLERPGVAVIGFVLSAQAGGLLRVGIENLRQIDGSWLFDAVACCDMGEDESGAQAVVPGQMAWRATGRRRTDDE